MLSIRRATLGDVDILVDLTQSSMDGTSQCDYRFPHARQYPDENAMYFRIRYTSMMTATDQNWTVYIASLSQGEEDQEKPIAFAFWRMDNLAEPAGSEVVIPRPEVLQILSEDEGKSELGGRRGWRMDHQVVTLTC